MINHPPATNPAPQILIISYTQLAYDSQNEIPEQLLPGNNGIEDTVLAECDAVHVRCNQLLMAKIKKQKKLIELNAVLLK